MDLIQGLIIPQKISLNRFLLVSLKASKIQIKNVQICQDVHYLIMKPHRTIICRIGYQSTLKVKGLQCLEKLIETRKTRILGHAIILLKQNPSLDRVKRLA